MPFGSDEVRAPIRASIERLFPRHGLSEELLEDCVSFALFLNSPRDLRTCLLKQLENLEAALLRRSGYERDAASQMRMRGALAMTRLGAKLAGRRSLDHKFPALSHLLSSELAESEKAWGFALSDIDGRPKAVMIAPLNGNHFRAQIRRKRPFKDPTILEQHGEFTHRLQWYLAGKAEIFTQPVADVYAAVGRVVYVPTPRFGLWDFLCDRDPNPRDGPDWLRPEAQEGTTAASDFRCAVYFHRWLCEQRRLCPILSTFLELRQGKRKMLREQAKEIGAFEYLALKFYGKSYHLLTADLQTEVRKWASQIDDPHGSKQERKSIADHTGIFTPLEGGGYRHGR